MSEDEMKRKYVEAHGRGYRDIPVIKTPGGMICKRVYEPVRPLPCVRDEHGAIKEQTVKQLLQKINEELDELKEAVFIFDDRRHIWVIEAVNEYKKVVAEEAADVKTAITTLEEVLGIDAAMRDEAIRRVNEKNRERGRLA